MNSEKFKLYLKEYREKNRDEINRKSREKYILNKDKKKEYERLNSDRIKKWKKEYAAKNSDSITVYQKKYNFDNKDALSVKQKRYYINNIIKIKESQKKYRYNNRSNIAEYERLYKQKRKLLDPVFKLKCNIKTLISSSIKMNGFIKPCKTEIILGCSFVEFKNYLESKFEPWMTWDNHGKCNGELNYGWDIDHIIPLYTANNIEDLIRLNHYANLQPLCSYTNRNIKRNNI